MHPSKPNIKTYTDKSPKQNCYFYETLSFTFSIFFRGVRASKTFLMPFITEKVAGSILQIIYSSLSLTCQNVILVNKLVLQVKYGK